MQDIIKKIYYIIQIVYYAPKEEKTWTVHISCKLPPSRRRGCQTRVWAGQFYYRRAYTIFHYTQAENTTHAFLSRERKWHFRPGYIVKKLCIKKFKAEK